MPLDVLDAESQGMIGYVLQQELGAALTYAGIPRPVVSVVTQVVVDAEDRAFTFPTKPIGSWLRKEAGEALKKAGIPIVEIDGKYRRTVPSPMPKAIVEIDAVRILLEAGCVPVVAGGGGIPVVREGSGYRGIAAVIDKDRTAALLAAQLNADLLLILTDVEAIEIDGRAFRELGADHAALALANGVFPPGSMGPKIEAALEARRTGIRAVVAHLDKAVDAVNGRSGTEIL
jgi:carbamate kinase